MLAEPRAVLPLIDLLDTAHDAYVLRCAVVALERFADRRAVPALSKQLLNLATPLVVRVAAVDALARIGGDEARAAIQRAMADPNASVRERAHQALHNRGQDGEGVVLWKRQRKWT
jgi:HEAT repeat protein